ncbi:MAG: SUMF1/EgtB/PvdO family nonheme iron enzyme [Chloroflexales bacterium]|nr:SUMF1/EgtB/PvdO family nonheme iron enzyme [Chloroflexales bacterium]
MNVQVAPDLSTSVSNLAQDLLDARQRELEVLSGLTDEQMYGSKMRIIEPPIWEMGHVGWFQERWILRNLYGEAPLWSNADTLYDSFNIPNAERWDLAFPSYQETLDYITAILQRCLKRITEQELTDEAAYFYRIVTNHEDMHGETMVHIRQTLGYPAPPIANTRLMPPPIDYDFEPHDVAIPGGTFMLGATQDMPFVLDNEKWAHPVELAPFHISAMPVTIAQYQAFVEAGGYQAREYWSAEGWEWRRKAGAEQPMYWHREVDGSWQRRVFDQYCPLDPFLPMMNVNFYEANAYCAWAGRRLPTEAEWEAAAAAEPGSNGRSFTQVKRLYPWGNESPSPERANLDSAALGLVDVRALPKGDSAFGCRQMLGNVWEWTADTFDAYPGFEIDPYETYSAPSFGQQKVLRGGCWVTRSRVIRNTWRNFYTPDRNNIFAGFRTCAT